MARQDGHLAAVISGAEASLAGLFVPKPSSWVVTQAHLVARLLRLSVNVHGGPRKPVAIVTQLVAQSVLPGARNSRQLLTAGAGLCSMKTASDGGSVTRGAGRTSADA